jgi:hypothetical protein
MSEQDMQWLVLEEGSPLACFLRHLHGHDSTEPILVNLDIQGRSSFREWQSFPWSPAPCDSESDALAVSCTARVCLFSLQTAAATSISGDLAAALRTIEQANFAVGFSGDPGTAALMRDVLQGERIPFLQGFTSSRIHHLEKETELVLLGRHAIPQPGFSRPLRVAAIMLVYNEADILPFTLEALVEQGIEVHVIDDGSDDGSFEIAEALHRQGKLASLRRSSVDGREPARWQALLREVEIVAASLEADWILHHDADEIRTSPWPDVSLKQGIEFVDAMGYTAVDFTVINFLFTSDQEPGTSASPLEALRYFEFPSHEANFTQVKAWKVSSVQPVLAESGGHDATFEGRSIYPLKFLTRHYPLRSAHQAASKLFLWRKSRFQQERQSMGWHVQYDPFQLIECIEPWSRSELFFYEQSVFDRFFLVERLSGCGLFRTPHVHVNRGTAMLAFQRYGDLQAELRDGLKPLLEQVMDHQRQMLAEQAELRDGLKPLLEKVIDHQHQLLTLQQEEREEAQRWRAQASTTVEETRDALMVLHGEFEAWRLRPNLWSPRRWWDDQLKQARALAGRLRRSMRGRPSS